MSKFYLTTPIYYPNARPHVGSAYTTIVCDVLARYKRMCGYDVAFLTGTDEHGEKLRRAAEAAETSPADFVAAKRELFKTLWQGLGISDYRFVHTSRNEAHRESVHWMIRQAVKAGHIEKRKYEGRYCVHDERYVSDSIEPANCDICGRPAELISEENYFFKLRQFEKLLLDLYERHVKDPGHVPFVQPEYRLNEVVSFVKSGLRDISISRKRLKWGIPWPDDPEQVVYVWYDALTSYLTGIGFRGERRSGEFDEYWPADVHMIGKDILRFHAVYWPAFLMAAGLPLPKTVFAHGWIYYEQDKMSKSKGNVVYPEPIVEALDSFGAPGNDALRYYLLREAPFGQDTSFSYDGLTDRYNFDLANDLGNLASRTVNMLHRYCGGELPAVTEPLGAGSLPQHQFTVMANSAMLGFEKCLEHYDLSGILYTVWELVSVTNRYLGYTQPWAIADDPSRQEYLKNILRTSAEVLRLVAVLLHPVMPEATKKLWHQLGQTGSPGDQRIDRLGWDMPGDPARFVPGTKVGKPKPIFPRLDKAATLAKLEELAEADREREKPKEATITVQSENEKPPAATTTPGPQPQAAPTPAPGTEKISIEDFAKVEMRTGEIKAAERVQGANKLLKLQVDIGTEVRQVVAGIAEYYEPEKLVGMKVVLVTNLQPRKLRGVESNGMIVAATVGAEGRPVLVTFKEDVPNGARLK